MGLKLRTKDGTLMDVPDSLGAITTYVLLEQERWFEKEIDFLLAWLKPDMMAIDIGANLGAYALPLARRIRQVVAYEPGNEARAHLEAGRTLNGAPNLTIKAAAVSDSVREGRLVLGSSTELSELGQGDSGEPVAITALDREDAENDWSPDFVKLDAEGQELNIIAGGRTFFTRHSPLVMFETRSDGEFHSDTIDAFVALGYRTYRSLPFAPLLVPFSTPHPLDLPWQLNCFGAKPDRAADLAAQGLLLDAVPDWSPNATARDAGLALLEAQSFSASFPLLFKGPIDPTYRDALAGYAVWRMSRDYGALSFAVSHLFELCRTESTTARLSTLARAAWEAGRRGLAIACLSRLRTTLAKRDIALNEPFWPASPRAETTAEHADPSVWFITSTLEQDEMLNRYSSYWGASGIDLKWLSGHPWIATEILRRHTLTELRHRRLDEIPERLCAPAPDHLNADMWRKALAYRRAGNK